MVFLFYNLPTLSPQLILAGKTGSLIVHADLDPVNAQPGDTANAGITYMLISIMQALSIHSQITIFGGNLAAGNVSVHLIRKISLADAGANADPAAAGHASD